MTAPSPKAPIISIAVIWILCGLTAAGGLNAYGRAEDKDLMQDPREARNEQRFNIVFGLAFGPIALAAAVLITGAFSDGWTLSGRAEPCTETAESGKRLFCGAESK